MKKKKKQHGLYRYSGSLKFKMVSMRSEQPTYPPPYLSYVPPTFLSNSSNVCLTLGVALSRPFKEDRRALPLSTASLLQMIDGVCPGRCARWKCLELLNTSDLPSRKPLLTVAFPASLFAQSFPFPPACPGQYTHRSLPQRWMLNIN